MNPYTHDSRSNARSGRYRGNTMSQRSNMTDSEQSNGYECEKKTPGAQTPQNQPEHAEGFTKIPPNESRRSKLQRIRQKEEDDLRRFKEENRPGAIHLAPERLGGAIPLTEVRQRQQMETNQSKLIKKLRKEDMDKIKRQAEEAEIQKMKAIQREKANKLEMKTKQEEEQRKKQNEHDKKLKTEQFLQRIERSSSTVSMASSNPIPASSWVKCHEYRDSRREEESAGLLKMKEEQRRKTEILEEKQKQQEEDRKTWTAADHRRVNLAFLDRLEANRSGWVSEPLTQTPESSNVWLDDDDEPQDTASSTVPNPSQVHTDSVEEDDCDHMWTLMKLQNEFPYYERDMLEDIVKQCNGDYQQAYDLLNV